MKYIALLLLIFFFNNTGAQEADSKAIRQVDSLIQVSRSLTGQGDFDKALEVNAAAEKIALEKIGKESAANGICAFNRGRVNFFKGDYTEAEIGYLEAISIQEKVLGKVNKDYASSLNSLANLYAQKGDYEKAEPLYNETLSIWEKVMGKEHQNYASSLNNLANLYENKGLFIKADSLYRESKTILGKVLGEKHPDYAQSLNSLADLYFKMGNYKNAEPLYIETMALRKNVLGEEHPDYAQSLNSLADLYSKMRNYKNAEPLYIEAMAIRKKVLGEEHPDHTTSLMNLGFLYYEMGDYAKAEPLHLEAKTILEKVFGKEHPEYAQSLNNLAFLYTKMGHYEKAEPLYIEAMAIRKKVLGEEHPDYASSLSNLAILYFEMGKYDKAEPIHLEAKTIREKILGKEHPDYASSLNRLAVFYFFMGKYDKAEQLYIEAMAIHEKVHGKEHPQYAESLNNLAVLYTNMGNFEKAEPYYIEAMAIRKKVHDKEHPVYASSLNSLANLYAKMGNFEKAEPLYLETKAIRKKALGEAHPDYAKTLDNLAVLYWGRGNFEKAEPLYIEAMAIRKKVLGKEHADYANSLNNLAGLYWHMSNFEKADSLYNEAKDIRKKALGVEHPDYAASLSNLAILYFEMGKYDKVEPLHLEAKNIRKKVLGVAHPDYAQSLDGLAGLYETQSRYAESTPLLKEVLVLEQTRIAGGISFLSERELAQYAATQQSGSMVNAYLLNRPDEQIDILPALCYDQSLFQKGFLMQAAARLQHLASSSPHAISINDDLKGFRRRIAQQLSLPIAKRRGLEELEENANALEKELSRTVAGYAEALRQVKWQEVKAGLKPSEAAIEFVHFKVNFPYKTDSTMYAALLILPDAEQPKFIPLFEESSLDSLLSVKSERKADYVNHLYSLADRGLVQLGSVKKSLYALLWKPLEKELTGIKTIYFSPAGLLHRINLDAIPISETETLADKYQLITLISTRLLAFPAQIAIMNRDAIVYGGINFEQDSTLQNDEALVTTQAIGEIPFNLVDATLRVGGWDYLSGTEREANAIEQIILKNGINTILKKGFNATEESVKNIGANQALSPRILHIATHGYFFPDPTSSPPKGETSEAEPIFKLSDLPMLRSGLIMTGGNATWQGKQTIEGREDGILTAYEISQMNLSDTELVVLSACETGLGDIQGNEGVYGLQRAFKIAGAKYLIMSLWQVPDKQTSLLMTTFYKKWLEEKMTIPEAFHAAQKQLRDNGLDPYNWAGFVLVE